MEKVLSICTGWENFEVVGLIQSFARANDGFFRGLIWDQLIRCRWFWLALRERQTFIYADLIEEFVAQLILSAVSLYGRGRISDLFIGICPGGGRSVGAQSYL